MKSRVRFEIVGRVGVNRGLDYPTFGITSEISGGELTTLTIEIDHPEHSSLDEIVQAARKALQPLCSLIGLGTTAEPALTNAFVSPKIAGEQSIGLGYVHVQARASIVRGLNEMPPETLLSRLNTDPRLARQIDYINSARIMQDIASRIRYGYLVLEQEQKRDQGYVPPASFRHIRNAVSHPELSDPTAKAFLDANIGSEQVDLSNTTHIQFLTDQCRLLLEETERVVENHVSRFWR